MQKSLDCIGLLPAGTDWLWYCIQVTGWLHCRCIRKVKKKEQWYSSFQHWTIFFSNLQLKAITHYNNFLSSSSLSRQCYTHNYGQILSLKLALSYSLMYCWWFLKFWKLCMMFYKICSCLMIHSSWRLWCRVFLALLI